MKFSILYYDNNEKLHDVKISVRSRYIALDYVTSLKDYSRIFKVTKLSDRSLQRCAYVGCKDDNLNMFRQ